MELVPYNALMVMEVGGGEEQRVGGETCVSASASRTRAPVVKGLVDTRMFSGDNKLFSNSNEICKKCSTFDPKNH